MIITREVDYAIRIFRCLVKEGKSSIQHITEVELVPKMFGYKIMRKLSDAQIVVPIRGKLGGYSLNVDLNDLNLLELMQALDAKEYLNNCLKDDYNCERWESSLDDCSVYRSLCVIQKKLDDMLTNTSVKSILESESTAK